MSDKATHKLVKTPKVNGRYLSDYMVASEIRQRSIIRDCKYRKIARVIQHDRAKIFVTNFLKAGSGDATELTDEGERLRNMMSDTDFERNTLDVNGDFLTAYGDVFAMDDFPKTAEIVDAPTDFKASLNGVEVNPDIRLGIQRVMRTNRLRTGLLTLRYAKGKPLDEEVGRYQSSVLFGIRKMIDDLDESAPEEKLCLTLDCASGKFIGAPTDATRRFQNVEAACASIAERWENIEPPEGAIF